MDSNNLITEEKRQQIIFILINSLKLKEEDADTLSHALMDISESLLKVYNNILPEVFIEKDRQKLIELLWKLSEEFRHIQYHIDDADLTQLLYVPDL